MIDAINEFDRQLLEDCYGPSPIGSCIEIFIYQQAFSEFQKEWFSRQVNRKTANESSTNDPVNG